MSNRYMKCGLTSLVMREMQIKIKGEYLTFFTMVTVKEKKKSCWQGCKEIKTFVLAGGNVKCCRSYGKQYGEGPQKIKNKNTIRFNSALPLSCL